MRLYPRYVSREFGAIFMMEVSDNLHDQKVHIVANELKEKGYNVIIEPPLDTLPFDLQGYQPDLIAFKDDGGVILEVKTQPRFSIESFQQVAENIAKHKHWRFLLVTLDDVDNEFSDNTQLPNWETLQTRLAQADVLIHQQILEPALLFLFSLIEAMLRKRAITQSIPVERLPFLKLLKHLYSNGELSPIDFDFLSQIYKERNKVAHGLNNTISTTELTELLKITNTLFQQWRTYN